MKISTPATTLLLSALTVVALTGCVPGLSLGGGATGGTDGSDGSGGSDGSDTSGATGTSDCAVGHVWSADVDDMAAQLSEQLSSAASLEVQSVTAEGSQLMTWNTDNTVSLDTSYVFTVKIDMGSGLIMTMVQSHEGPSSGTLTLDGTTAEPGNWDNAGYTIQTTVDINGSSSDMAFDLPSEGIREGVQLQITCDGSEMTTVAEGGLFSQSWTRAD